jgi:CubicO group peptidase (beta-lactamase class C family)
MPNDQHNISAYQDLLDELRDKHGVVGATLGVLKDGAIDAAASGLLNLDTKVEATPDSVFQIGSIGKVFTTTLIMQLIDEGRLNLDDKVSAILREFTLLDREAARAITVRQLLTHTSGMDGDFFAPDDPEGPSTASYVRKMCLLPNLYPPGRGPVTYCNAGFVTAGRIVEVLTGMTWQEAVTRRITKPLGLTHVVAHLAQTLRYRCAMGHIFDPNDMTKTVMAPATHFSLSAAPAGALLSMSVASLLEFAKVHLADGRMGDGKMLLSEASARRMREELTPVPPFGGVTHWGLGWAISLAPGYRMAGHDGGTIGQFSYLRTFPERGTAFALLTNSPSFTLFQAIEARLSPELAGASPPEEPAKTAWTPQPDRYIGRYETITAVYAVEPADGGLAFRVTSKVGFPGGEGMLEPWCNDVFALQAKNTPMDGQKIAFVGDNKSAPAEFIRIGLRMARRVN